MRIPFALLLYRHTATLKQIHLIKFNDSWRLMAFFCRFPETAMTPDHAAFACSRPFPADQHTLAQIIDSFMLV
jgi:hypothetical protein